MPNEAWSASPTPPHQSLESLKQTFSQRLDKILYKELTVENVETFADDALNETIKLTDDVLQAYSRNPNFHALPNTLNTQEQENEAFKILELPDIQEVLQSISDVKQKIDALKNYLKTGVKNVDTIITPPNPEHRTEILEGSGEFVEKKLVPRLLTLLYIIEHDFQIPSSSVQITQGKVTPNMMRKAPYARVEIPDLKRAVYICDEEGNASYILDTEEITAQGLTLEEIDLDDKRDKNSLIDYYPGIGIRISQSPTWRDRISEILREPITKNRKVVDEEPRNVKEDLGQENKIIIASRGELDPWRGFWTDHATGEHWGTIAAIAKKLKRTVIIFKHRGKDNRLRKQLIKIVGRGEKPGRIEDAYCVEQVLSLFPELQPSERPPEIKGEWRGFWTDPKTGKHWGTARALMIKFDVNDWITIIKFAKRGNLTSVPVTDLIGRKTEGFCYEDFLEVDRFMEFLTAPEVSEDGEWQGFWTDNEGQHWATVGVLSSYFNLSDATINKYIKKIGLKSKKVKSLYKEALDAFPLEGLKDDPEFTNYLNLPPSNKEGEWQGFWTDPVTGKHWGSILPLAQKLEVSRDKVSHFVGRKRNKIKETKMIRTLSGHEGLAYCFEEFQEYFKK